jgi:putative FmdB family regulatory protein
MAAWGFPSRIFMSDGSEMNGNKNGGAPMPFYEFACQDCSKQFSLVLSVKERESGRVTCPGCGSTNVTALISSFTAKTSKKS